MSHWNYNVNCSYIASFHIFDIPCNMVYNLLIFPFLQIVWKHLYDPASSGDKGTLYAARNYLNAQNVSGEEVFMFAIFPPLGAPPKGPPGVYMPYMNNFGSLPPNNDPYQALLKSAHWFWRK